MVSIILVGSAIAALVAAWWSRQRRPRTFLERVADVSRPAPPLTLSPWPAADYAGGCRGDRDGDCSWAYCPQIRDGEPMNSGRHCPRDVDRDEEA